MKNILVAIDGSDHANRALDTSIEIAKSTGAGLTILHVSEKRGFSDKERQKVETEYGDELRRYVQEPPTDEIPSVLQEGAIGVLQSHSEQAAAIREILGEAILATSKNRAEQAGVETVRTALKFGDPATRIVEAAREGAADLVVVGSHGHDSLVTDFLGSVSHKVLHHSAGSVLIAK